MNPWILGGALVLGFIVGMIWEARQNINQVTRKRETEEPREK